MRGKRRMLDPCSAEESLQCVASPKGRSFGVENMAIEFHQNDVSLSIVTTHTCFMRREYKNYISYYIYIYL